MCGISVIWSWNALTAPARLHRMVAAQQHRGPDGAGLAVWDDEPAAPTGAARTHWTGPVHATWPAPAHGMRFGMGHNLLAIQDPDDAARQPMRDPSGRWWLTYNGEIYNFPELRADLARDGVHCTTHSDTEVLLALWVRHGVGSLARLRGMFAFALYDAQDDTLWLARDPFGIKPLHVARLADGSGVVVASELRGIHASGLVPRAWDPGALRAFLAAGVNRPGPTATCFTGVQELEPGTVMQVRPDGTSVHRFHTLADIDIADATIDRIEPLRDRFEESVRLHLRSSREVGVCLSGGLDSANIAYAASRMVGDGALQCFTVGAAESRDVRLAVQAARSCGVRHHLLTSPTTVAMRDVADMITACETPNHTWGPINQYLLLRRIAGEHGVSVLLNGQGGDEALSAYAWFVPPLADAIARRDGPEAAATWRAACAAREPMAPSVTAAAQAMYHSRRAWMGTFDGGACAALGLDPREVVRSDPVQYFLNDALDWAGTRRQQLTVRELPHLLRQEDRLAMWFSIESRVPFVDPALVDLCGHLDPAFLYHDGYAKYPLRVMQPALHAPLRWETTKTGYWAPHSSMPPLAAGTAALWDASAGMLATAGLRTNPAAVARLSPLAAWRFFQVLALSHALDDAALASFTLPMAPTQAA
ncbi:MAG: asparagine synthase (glutamine-hydrolyzing) [Gemmatimonadaceae bacterium]|nr:asparagine synthase (glutamine-hydrolyzing) [Gemmatimonadaceae bacterium]